jgi:Na+/proline symporter
MIVTSFIVSLFIFLVIGLWASSKHVGTTEDYLLAGRKVNPWLAGLSATATEKSGFTFVAYVGLVYNIGISGIWLYLGMYAAYLMALSEISHHTKKVSDEHKFETYTDLLIKHDGVKFTKLGPVIGIITIIFLGLYAAAQLTAGSKALHVLFGWPEMAGALIGTSILFLYSYSGGIRASIWTDAAQMVAMIIAMGFLFVGCIHSLGGMESLWWAMSQVEDGGKFTSFAPEGFLPAFLFFLGWFFAGLGLVGQPHIMIRFMTVDCPTKTQKVFNIFMVSNFVFVIFTTAVAMCARLLLDNVTDPELTLPMLALNNMNEIMAGLMLAGLFACTMSTADSQVLSCSAALSQNIITKWPNSYLKAKLCTAAIIAIVLSIALFGSKSVFDLVSVAWGGLAAAFGPLAIIRLLKWPLNEAAAMLMTLGGLMVAVYWRFSGLSDIVFETVPGMVSGFVFYGIAYYALKLKKTSTIS